MPATIALESRLPPELGVRAEVIGDDMAPDNNNAFFADMVAKDFIVNQNQTASKNIRGPWKKPPP